MANESTMKGRLGDLQRLTERLADNSEELSHLEWSRVRLEGMVAQAAAAAGQQAVATAAKQEASQQLRALVVEAERLATVLRYSVKQFYGIRSEKLSEFGLQPFRGRPSKPVTPPPVETVKSEPAAG